MYDQFLAYPSSVDAAWHDFFADYKPTQSAQSKSETALDQAFSSSNGQAVKPAPVAPPATAALARSSNGAPSNAATVTPMAPKIQAAPAKAAPTPAGRDTTEPESKQLRGAAAAIAKNMDASLSVPTATSVRAVPAKLMADNRIVINNHLKRTRGGKISFTHIIGYAMVRALQQFPNMNRHYLLIDGK